MVKFYTVITIFLLSMNANACPDFSGEYNCVSSVGVQYDVQIIHSNGSIILDNNIGAIILNSIIYKTDERAIKGTCDQEGVKIESLESDGSIIKYTLEKTETGFQRVVNLSKKEINFSVVAICNRI